MRKHLVIFACVVFASVPTGLSSYAQAPATTYDGKYIGQVTNVENINAQTECGAGGFLKTLTIQNGSFSLVYNAAHYETIKGTVGADGTISGFGTSSGGGIRLTGKIQGGAITGQVFSATCRYSYQLTKSQ